MPLERKVRLDSRDPKALKAQPEQLDRRDLLVRKAQPALPERRALLAHRGQSAYKAHKACKVRWDCKGHKGQTAQQDQLDQPD